MAKFQPLLDKQTKKFVPLETKKFIPLPEVTKEVESVGVYKKALNPNVVNEIEKSKNAFTEMYNPEHVGAAFVGKVIPDILKPEFISRKEEAAEGTLGGAVGGLAGDVVPILVGYGLASKIPLIKGLTKSGSIVAKTGGRFLRATTAATLYDIYKGKYDIKEIAKDVALFTAFDVGLGSAGDVIKAGSKIWRDLKSLGIPEIQEINDAEYFYNLAKRIETIENEGIKIGTPDAKIYAATMLEGGSEREAIDNVKLINDKIKAGDVSLNEIEFTATRGQLRDFMRERGYSEEEIQKRVFEEAETDIGEIYKEQLKEEGLIEEKKGIPYETWKQAFHEAKKETPFAPIAETTYTQTLAPRLEELMAHGYPEPQARRMLNTFWAKSEMMGGDRWANLDQLIKGGKVEEITKPIKEAVERSQLTGIVPKGLRGIGDKPKVPRFSDEAENFISNVDSSYSTGGTPDRGGFFKRHFQEFRGKFWFAQEPKIKIRNDPERYPQLQDKNILNTKINDMTLGFNHLGADRENAYSRVEKFEMSVLSHTQDIPDPATGKVVHYADDIMLDGLRLTSAKAILGRLKFWPQEIFEVPYLYTSEEAIILKDIEKRIAKSDNIPEEALRKLVEFKATKIKQLERMIPEMEAGMHEQSIVFSDELFMSAHNYGLENEGWGILPEGTIASHPFYMPFDVLSHSDIARESIYRRSMKKLRLGHTLEAKGSFNPINTNWVEAMKNYIYDSELARAQIKFERTSYRTFHDETMKGASGWSMAYTRPKMFSNVVGRHVDLQLREVQKYYRDLLNETVDEKTRAILTETMYAEIKRLAPGYEEFIVPDPIVNWVNESSAPYLAADAEFKRSVANLTMFAKRNWTYRLHLGSTKFHLGNLIGDFGQVMTLYENSTRALQSLPWAIDVCTRDFGANAYIDTMNKAAAMFLKSKGLDGLAGIIGKRFTDDVLDQMIYREIQNNSLLQGGRYFNEALKPGIRFLEPSARKAGIVDVGTLEGVRRGKKLKALGLRREGKIQKLKTGVDIALDEIDKVLIARENVLRVAIYRDMRRAGIPEAEALDTLDKVLVDYGRKTPIERWWANSLTPFLSYKKGSITNDIYALVPAFKRNEWGNIVGIGTRRGLAVALKTAVFGYGISTAMRAYNEYYHQDIEELLYKRSKDWVTSVPHIVTDLVTKDGGRLIIGYGTPHSELSDFFGLHEYFHRFMKKNEKGEIPFLKNFVETIPNAWDITRHAAMSNIKEMAGPIIKIPYGLLTYKDLYTGYSWGQETDKWLPWINYDGDDVIDIINEFKKFPSAPNAGKLLRMVRFLDRNVESNFRQVEQFIMSENEPYLQEMKWVMPNVYVMYPNGRPEAIIKESEWAQFLNNLFTYTVPAEQEKLGGRPTKPGSLSKGTKP